MKLLCIQTSDSTDNLGEPAEPVKEGQTYTSTGFFKTQAESKWVHTLKERPEWLAYDANLFVPLSDIDETDTAHCNKVKQKSQFWY